MTEHTSPAAQVLTEATDAARVGLLPEGLVEFFGEPIHTYTRAQAIADGVLVDITTAAHTTYRQYRGFPSVAMTTAAHADTVAWSEEIEDRKPEYTGQDETARLADVLWMALGAMRRNAATNRITFSLDRVPPTGRGIRARTVQLVVALSGGDNGEPVLTIMQPTED